MTTPLISHDGKIETNFPNQNHPPDTSLVIQQSGGDKPKANKRGGIRGRSSSSLGSPKFSPRVNFTLQKEGKEPRSQSGPINSSSVSKPSILPEPHLSEEESLQEQKTIYKTGESENCRSSTKSRVNQRIKI